MWEKVLVSAFGPSSVPGAARVEAFVDQEKFLNPGIENAESNQGQAGDQDPFGDSLSLVGVAAEVPDPMDRNDQRREEGEGGDDPVLEEEGSYASPVPSVEGKIEGDRRAAQGDGSSEKAMAPPRRR